MECRVCGRSIVNESANFCENCGTSLRSSYEQESQLWEYQGNKKEAEAVTEEKQNAAMTFKQWIGIMILPFIPVIGTSAYLVLLFIWGFGNETSEPKKSWARASLVIAIISIVLFSLVVIGWISLFLDTMDISELLKLYQSIN